MTETLERPDEDQAWLEWRRGGITASDIAAAASGRYGGAYGVVATKLGLLPPKEYTPRMARGHAWEDRIASAAEILTGLHIVGEQTWCQHKDRPEWRATIDGFAAPIEAPTIDDVTHVLEIKTRGIEVRPAWDYWASQIQWQMLVTGVDRAILAELVIDDAQGFDGGIVTPDLRLHLIEADPMAQADLASLADRLAAHVADGTLPDPDDPSHLDIVKSVTATVDEDAETVDLTDLADVVERFDELKAAISTATAEQKLLEARIRAAVGEATTGRTDRYTVSVSRPTKVRTDAGNAAFLAAHPDLAKPVEIDTARARKEAKADFDAIPREAIGARKITTKENTQ